MGPIILLIKEMHKAIDSYVHLKEHRREEILNSKLGLQQTFGNYFKRDAIFTKKKNSCKIFKCHNPRILILVSKMHSLN